MKKGTSIWLLFALCLLVPATLFAFARWYKSEKHGLPLYHEGNAIPAYTLINQDGTPIGNATGGISVVGFFFTHCTTICPKMIHNLKTVAQAHPQIDIRTISIDPVRDSAGQLKDYAGRFSIPEAHWQLLTGDKKRIYQLARQSYRIDASEGAADFIHSDKLVLVDAQQRIRGYYAGTEAAAIQKLILDIKKLQHEN